MYVPVDGKDYSTAVNKHSTPTSSGQESKKEKL